MNVENTERNLNLVKDLYAALHNARARAEREFATLPNVNTHTHRLHLVAEMNSVSTDIGNLEYYFKRTKISI